MARIKLRGTYQISDKQGFQARMDSLDGDPRYKFYEAMRSTNRYEDYEAAVGHVEALIESRKDSPFTGHVEILHARRKGWITDGNF